MRNRYPSPELLQEIANLRFELTEEECRKRAERMEEQASEDGRSAMVRRLRDNRRKRLSDSRT